MNTWKQADMWWSTVSVSDIVEYGTAETMEAFLILTEWELSPASANLTI